MDKIGRYEVLQEIGYGGMANVYKAHDPQISRTLAIKVLRPERCRDEEYRRRFLREAKAVGTLSHPNIVTIYDISEINNTPYIAMELLEGVSLDRLMKSEYKPTNSEILDWSVQLADALEYAHKRGIVHRDIKPSNIVLSPDKKTLKITDFGIAHFDETDVTQHTQLGEVLGTPQYMSPEQVLGKQADARSDLFSVGVIMYQLLTGQKPFQADTLATLLFQIATENPEPIGQVAPDLPASLKQTVDKLLKKKPEKRFQSGAELKRALLKIISDLKQVDGQGKSEIQTSILLKWLAFSTLTLLFVLALGGLYLFEKQNELLTDQLSKQGMALSRFIAFESAESVLSEDWPSVELFVQHLSEQQSFTSLDIVDHKNMVRGSTDETIIATQYKAATTRQSKMLQDVTINEVSLGKILEYEYVAPIYFQTTEIGKVYLRIDASEVKRQANIFMTNYILVSAFVVFISALLIALFSQQIRKPIRLIMNAMREIGDGNNAYRIGIIRKDEFGQLIHEFDHMASNIQSRDEINANKS